MSTVIRDGGKVYIAGVRKISWDTGEMCEFASALISALACLGENIPYPYVMGTCGAAFRFTLNPGEWDPGNYGIRNISTDPDEPMRRAIAATGYAYTLCEKSSRQEDTARIMRSIDRGIPVLAYPVVGPSDCCIITGYDEDGEVLLGWSTYQDIPDDHNIPPDVTGYFRKPGWHDNLVGFILLGDKAGGQSRRTIYLDALQWAVQLARAPQKGDKVTGLKGLKAWAAEMTEAKNFPQGDEGILGWRYLSTAVNITMLRDHCLAEPFLRQIAAEEPDFLPEVALAADCYQEVIQLRAGQDSFIKDDFSAGTMQAIADPEARRGFARLIFQIRDKEEEAIQHIERLLERS
jgi:hypothetical protein